MTRLLAYFQTAHIRGEVSTAKVAGLHIPYRVSVRSNEALKLGVASALCAICLIGFSALWALS